MVITDEGATIKIVDGSSTIYVDKHGASIKVDGDYVSVGGIGIDNYKILYTDVTSPLSASAAILAATLEGYLETGGAGTITNDGTFATPALQGALTETAPATDTASSGQNGRLQRIAQRLTSLIAIFPTSLGQGTMATSLKVAIASDQSAVSTTTEKVSTSNTPSIASSATAAASNTARKGILIQNLGTNPLFVRFGASASITVFHTCLKACTVADDGNGGTVFNDRYTGIVTIDGTSPRYTVYEF